MADVKLHCRQGMSGEVSFRRGHAWEACARKGRGQYKKGPSSGLLWCAYSAHCSLPFGLIWLACWGLGGGPFGPAIGPEIWGLPQTWATSLRPNNKTPQIDKTKN